MSKLRWIGIGLLAVGVLCIGLWQRLGVRSSVDVLLNVQFEPLAGGQPVVRVSCNDELLYLMVDTGSGYDVVLIKGQEGRTHFLREADPNGQTPEGVPKYHLAHLRVQLAEVPSASIVVTPIIGNMEDFKEYFKRLQGFLGFGFLQHFVTRIDWQAKTVTLSRSPIPDLTASHTLPLELVTFEGLVYPAVHARFRGKELLCVIDTGSDISMLPISYAKRFAGRQRKRILRTANLQGEQEEVWLEGEVGPITVGCLTFPKLLMHSPAPTKRPKMPSFVYRLVSKGYGLLGCNLLQRFRLTLDVPGRKAYFELYPSPSSSPIRGLSR